MSMGTSYTDVVMPRSWHKLWYGEAQAKSSSMRWGASGHVGRRMRSCIGMPSSSTPRLLGRIMHAGLAHASLSLTISCQTHTRLKHTRVSNAREECVPGVAYGG